jgi:hypothetical protein
MTLETTFDFSVNVMKALLWRYNNAKNLTALLQSKQTWYDENYTEFWNDWYTNVFNLETANNFGCAVWAIILGLSLNISDTAPITETPFGFSDYNSNFGNSNFSPNVSNPIFLSNDENRQLLQLRYYQLTTRGAGVLKTNQALKNVFGDITFASGVTAPRIYLIDNLNMTFTAHYDPAFNAGQLAVLQQNDLLPRPSGVLINYVSG